MNHLLLGAADKTEQLLQWASKSYLLIDDGSIVDAFLDRGAKLFDITKHAFNPLRHIDYKRARDFADIVYSASPQGESTLTVRNGKRALTKHLLETERLDRLHTTDEEVQATIEDILLSPVLQRVICNPTNFSFKGAVVLKLNRAELGDFDCFLLANLAMQQCKGQIIIPDFGFYGRNADLIRQNRLVAGVNFLAELPDHLRNEVLLIDDKIGHHCLPEDADVLASHAGLAKETNEYNDFILHNVDRFQPS